MSKLMAVVLSFFFSCAALAQDVPTTQSELHAKLIADLLEQVRTQNLDIKFCVFTPATGVEERIPEGCSFEGKTFVFGKDSGDSGSISVAVQDAEGVIHTLIIDRQAGRSKAKVIGLGIETQGGDLALTSTTTFMWAILSAPPNPSPSSLARK